MRKLMIGLYFVSVFTIHPVAIFLHGISSAGKSTLCNYVATLDQWKVVASLYWDYFPVYLEQQYPNEFFALNTAIASYDIAYAVRRNVIVFKKDITEIQKNDAFESIKIIREKLNDSEIRKVHMNAFREYTLDMIKQHLDTGNHVFLDLAWYITPEDVQQLYSGKIIQALVYCSLEETVCRIIKRNQEAIHNNTATNCRFFKEGMTAFFKFYDVTQDSTSSIDILTKESAERALTLAEEYINNYQQINDYPWMVKEFTKSEFEEYKQNILRKFEHSNFLYIKPRIAFDIFVPTEKLSSDEFINMLSV